MLMCIFFSYNLFDTFLNILFHYDLSQDTDYSSLGYTLGPCSCILKVIVCTLADSLFMICGLRPSAPGFSPLDYWTVPWLPAPGDTKPISGSAPPFASPSLAHWCPPESLGTLTQHSRPWVIQRGPSGSISRCHSFPCILPPPWSLARPVHWLLVLPLPLL